MRHMWSSFVHQHNECDITCVLEHLMHILHLPGWLFSPRCINLLMQSPEFLTAASLCLVIQGFHGIVVIPYELVDTSCINLVTLLMPDALLCYCSVQIWASYWVDFVQLLWWTFIVNFTELQEHLKSLFGQPWLLQRAAITLVFAACNLFFPAVLDPFTLGHIHSISSCERAIVCAGVCWP